MKEKDIFTLIKEDNIEAVKSLVEKEPLLVNSVAPKKPVDTKGMSPLQVSMTTGWHKDIIDYLLDNGADVNFMEAPELHIPQAHPVLHDAVSIAIWNSRRYGCVDPDDIDAWILTMRTISHLNGSIQKKILTVHFRFCQG